MLLSESNRNPLFSAVSVFGPNNINLVVWVIK
jgi:hypothetical protein